MKLLKGNRNQISEEGLGGEKPSKEVGLGQSKVSAALSLLNCHISSLRFLWLFVLREVPYYSEKYGEYSQKRSCLTTQMTLTKLLNLYDLWFFLL